MNVGLHANMCDSDTERIARALHTPFDAIGRELSKDYGGTMEHLWIDFELIEAHARFGPAKAFRFQKSVGGSSPDKLTGLPRLVHENVGHYSVRPDFRKLMGIPEERLVEHVLNLIYASTSILLEKQKKLGGFDAGRFRSEFVAVCRRHGYEISDAR